MEGQIKTAFLKIFAPFALTILLCGCPAQGPGEAEEFHQACATPVVNFAVLKSEVLAPMCIHCHQEYNTEAGLADDVVAGHPERSPLFHAVDTGVNGVVMPKDGNKLADSYIQCITRYIDQLNPSSTPAPTPPQVPLPPLEPKYSSLSRNLIEVSCYGCHGVSSSLKVGSKLPNLSTYEGVKANASGILDRITTSDEDDMMPPPDKGRPAPKQAVIDAFNQWMKNGFPE